MLNDERYIAAAESFEKIAKSIGEEGLAESAKQIRVLCGNFDVKVLFIGHFSAGKSALINCLIGRENFLEENTAPMTTIATELYYTEGEEKCTAFKNDGTCIQLNVNPKVDPNEYSHIAYGLNVDILKELEGYTVVDLPGFDSNIENHNKALNNYISKGAAYILVADIDRGGLDARAISFLKEVSVYSERIAVLLNKCDKKTEEDIEKIQLGVKDQLDMYGIEAEVYCVSKYNPNTVDLLKSIIFSFEIQEIFDDTMQKFIRNEANVAKGILSDAADKVYLDVFDIDNEIKRIERVRKQTSQIFSEKKHELLENVQDNADEIMASISNALNANSGLVADAAISGGSKALEAVIMESIRPVFIDSIRGISKEVIDDIAATLSQCNAVSDSDNSSQMFMSIAEKAKQLIDQNSFAGITADFDANSEENQPDEENKLNGEAIYKVVTGILAICTNVVAPWLELIIVMLPDIVKIVNKFLGGTQHDKVRQNLEKGVFPQIIAKLRPSVEQCTGQSVNSILDNFEAAVNEKLAVVDGILTETKNKRQGTVDEYENYKNALKNALEELEELSEI